MEKALKRMSWLIGLLLILAPLAAFAQNKVVVIPLFGDGPDIGQQNIIPGTLAQTIFQGYHDGTGEVAGDADLASGNIVSGVTIFGVPGSALEASGDAQAAHVLTGRTFSRAGAVNVEGTMPNVGQQNIISGTSAQTIFQGYHDGTGEVAGDADLVSGNIKKGVEIFNVTGDYESASVPKTGQTTCWDATGNVIDCAGTGQDGELQRGVAWPAPRFYCNPDGVCDNGDGTVTDNLTGLIWLKNADCFGTKTWTNALADANGLAHGSCGLTDGSSAGDWRLPNVRELHSLVDYGRDDPALPGGHPFVNVGTIGALYWSSTTREGSSSSAWHVNMRYGIVNSEGKSNSRRVWPVRDGQ